MKNIPDHTDAIHLPPDLLEQARQTAREEHRSVDELVCDAVRRYLQERKQAATTNTSEPVKKKRLSELFAPLRGLDIDFSRNPSTGRPVDLGAVFCSEFNRRDEPDQPSQAIGNLC